MSLTPNQKDLLAKKTDLEGVLKPDENNILHLPDVTISLSETEQGFSDSIINENTLLLKSNTTENKRLTIDGEAGLTFTDGQNVSNITGITSAAGNSSSLAASQSMVSAKQDRLTAGTNITIENNVISAQGGGSDVSITPTLATGTKIADYEINGVSGSLYAPQGGGTASAMSDLTDVDLTNLANGQVLKYNSTTEKWENANESGGGGSSITPNPQGTPTDTLSTIEIDGTIYNIEGSGGGGSVTAIEEIYKNTVGTIPDTINLTKPINDFDIILITGFRSNTPTWKMSTFYVSANINPGDVIELNDDAYYAWYTVTDLSTLTRNAVQYDVIDTIYGLKFGSGGGSSGGSGYTETTLFTGDMSSSSGEISLSDDLNNYDQIIFWVRWSISSTNGEVPFMVDRKHFVETFLYDNGSTDQTSPHLVCQIYDGQYLRLKCGSANNKLFIYDSHYSAITKVIGLKYGGGGGSASAEEITLNDYNELTSAQKNDGTIRFIPESSIGTTTPINMLNPTNISESSNIVITPSEKSVEMTWDTSTSSGIAATFYYSRIDVTNYDYLVYDLITGDSYDSLHPNSQNPIRDLGIGLCSSAPSTWTYAPNVNWTIWNRYEVTDTNRDLGTQTLDVSELNGEYYLVIACVAWEATISNLKYATSSGNESQIKYMDKTYGLNNSSNTSAMEMTLAEYNALTTEEKNDDTIRFIPAGSSSVASAIDMTDITVYREGGSAMSVTSTSSKIDITWNGGMAIACNIDFNTPIDVTDYDSITFKVTNGSCYSNGTQAMYPRWDMMIGLRSTPFGQIINVEPTDSNWAAVADMSLSNHVYEETLDVSELTGSYYLVISGHGWNSTIEDITLKQGGAYPSQIKYMGKTYGISSGEGGSGDIVIVSRTDNTNGYAWLIPCDASGNALKPSEVTLLSIFADADMSGTPPYYNGLNVCVDTDQDRYYCKLYNTQTGDYVPDGTYSVDYTVAYIPNSGSSSESGSSSHTYSTTEQKVGTWIDGSDIYEKSFEIQLPSSYDAFDNDGFVVENDASYIEALIGCEISAMTTTGRISTQGINALGWMYGLHRNNSNQLIIHGGSEYAGGKAWITIRYTKVTS